MSISWFKTKRVSNLFLLLIVSLGIILSISGSNIFVIYLGMELKMFGIIPFILLKRTERTGGINVRIYYFLVQVFGRMLFLWGNLINIYILGIIGLRIKMGVSPFFWWVPSIFSRLDWFSIGIIGSIQKIPSFIILRGVFDFPSKLGLFISISGLIISIIGINYSNKKLKNLIAWSSVGKISLLYYLIILNFQIAFMFFICYITAFLLIIYILFKNSLENINFWSYNKFKSDLLIAVGLGILIFSGLPPLLGFQWKVLFFGALKTDKIYMMIHQTMVLDVKDYLVEYPLWQDMDGYNLSIIFSTLLILQIIAYIKVFINIYMSFSNSLENSRRYFKVNKKTDYYFFILSVLSLIFLFS